MLADPGSSRAATNALLAVLRDGRWRPSAWARFLARATERSIREARARPRAVVELSALHAGFVLLGQRKRLAWTLTSWALAVTHLGMLEGRRSIGWANAITLARANLPTLTDAWWLPLLAVGTDLVDGRVARRLATDCPFGAAADALADATFWTWYAVRREPSRVLRTTALLAWAAPVVTVTGHSIREGRMVDPPRPVVVRPAAALQAVLAARCVARHISPSRRGQRVATPRRGADGVR